MAVPHDWQSADVEDSSRLVAWLRELDIAATRDIALTQAQGLLGENFSRYLAQSGSAMVTGTIYYQGAYLVKGDVVTNIHPRIVTLGAGITACKVGVYDNAGTLVASSADLGTSWQTAGMKTHALSTPYSVTSSGLYYLALFCTFVTTAPQPARSTALSGSFEAVGSGKTLMGAQTGQVDLITPGTVSNGNQVGFWVGWS